MEGSVFLKIVWPLKDIRCPARLWHLAFLPSLTESGHQWKGSGNRGFLGHPSLKPNGRSTLRIRLFRSKNF